MYCIKQTNAAALVVPEGLRGTVKRLVWIKLEAGHEQNLIGRICNAQGDPLNGKVVIHESNKSFIGAAGQFLYAAITLEGERFSYAKEAEIVKTFVGFEDRQILIKSAVFSVPDADEANKKLHALLAKRLRTVDFCPRIRVGDHAFVAAAV